jgi:hypothetical protein
MAYQALKDLWLSLIGGAHEPKEEPRVVLHDPSADKPHDLDDPFHDPQVQSRMAATISNAVAKKK